MTPPPYFSDDDVREMQRREREDDERAYAAKARRDELEERAMDAYLSAETPEAGKLAADRVRSESELPRSTSYSAMHVIGLHRETGQWSSVDSSGLAGALEFWREHHNPAVWTEFKLARRVDTVTWTEVDDGPDRS